MCCGSHLFIRSVFFSPLSSSSKSIRLLLSIEHLCLKPLQRLNYRRFTAFHNVPSTLPLFKLKSDSRRCFFYSERYRCGNAGLESLDKSKHVTDPVVANAISPPCLSTTGGTALLDQAQDGASGRTAERSNSLVRAENKIKHCQLIVAVDIDEVLGSFLMALNTFVAEHYLREHTVSDYHVYDFTEVWRCSRTEADLRVHAFFKSKNFARGIVPIPGAYQSLLRIASYCQLYVVTSRQNAIKEATLAWIERHYSGIFQDVHFGNHFAFEGEARSKSEICRCLGARVLVDDNPVYAMDCAKNGIEVLLFDYNNSYPWSKTHEGPIHPSITRVHNWEEVEESLQARSHNVHR